MNTNPHADVRGKVLVIDDEPAIRVTLKRLLQTAGHEVETAPSGREGLILFQQGIWDAVTVDRSMPDMNGEEVAEAIRHLSPGMPIVMITGFPGAVKRRDLFQAIVGKPFHTAEFLQNLGDIMRQRGECRLAQRA